MNASKYLNSRLGKTIEQIKKAYLSDKHICFIVCSEPEFIKEIIDSGSLFPNNKQSKTDSETSVRFVEIVAFINSQLRNSDITSPHLFVYNGMDGMLPLQSLTNYVNHITELTNCNLELNIHRKEKLNCLKESIILIPVNSKPQIPAYIEPYSETIVVPFMDEYEFKEFVSLYLKDKENVKTTVNANGYEVVENDDYLTRLYQNMLCLNKTQIKGILCKSKMLLGNIYYEKRQKKYEERIEILLNNIKHEFEQLIETSRALTVEEPSSDAPAGLQNITRWIEKNKNVVNKYSQSVSEYMLKGAKGMIISGVPGTGKSMMAKYIAGALGLRLLRFDLGNIGGGYVGDSERNMDEALKIIESLTPCVLWIDEIEKAFSGAKENSHETSKRVFGKFLFWLQERCTCFIFATSNNISELPSELFRNGRFDLKYFTFMPTAKECAQIFESTIRHQNKKYMSMGYEIPLFDIHEINETYFLDKIIKKCLRYIPDSLDYKEVNRLNRFFIGADIAQLIEAAKNMYFNEYQNISKSEQKAKYNSENFKHCIETVCESDSFKTYGETDLENIAKCYAQLVANNFNSASSEIVLPFEGYDELGYIMELQKAKSNNEKTKELYSLKDEEAYCKNLSEYDKCLYIIVRNVINRLAIQIIKERRKI